VDADALKATLAEMGVGDLVAVLDPAWRPRSARSQSGVEGTMEVAGLTLRFGFWLPDDFPAALPKVFGLSPELLRLPHIDEHHLVCAFEGENTLLDYRREQDLVRETVQRVRRVVEDGLLGLNRGDFFAEFEAYWPRELEVPSVVVAGDEPMRIKASFDGHQLVALAPSDDEIHSHFPNKAKQLKRAVYLPLEPFELAGRHPRDLCSWDDLVPLLSDNSSKFARAHRVAKKQILPVVVGVPRRDGERALVGILLRRFTADGSLLTARPREAQPFTVARFDADRVRERLPLTRQGGRIVVVGCGSVGGHLAHALAWTGVRELVLVDPDLGGPGNTFRHVLGRRLWLQQKVYALKKELELCIPGLVVTPIPKAIDAALAQQPDLLKAADVVVVAIGNHSVPLQLNDALAQQKTPVPVVFTWLEPYGIGGHAVLVNYREPGCLRCLFADRSGLQCKVEFSEPNQRFARRDLGCHALYTPYGDTDARATALLAARLVAQATNVESIVGTRRAWRGDAGAFESAGFRLSPRYADHVSDAAVPLEVLPECSACGR